MIDRLMADKTLKPKTTPSLLRYYCFSQLFNFRWSPDLSELNENLIHVETEDNSNTGFDEVDR